MELWYLDLKSVPEAKALGNLVVILPPLWLVSLEALKGILIFPLKHPGYFVLLQTCLLSPTLFIL